MCDQCKASEASLLAGRDQYIAHARTAGITAREAGYAATVLRSAAESLGVVMPVSETRVPVAAVVAALMEMAQDQAAIAEALR